MSSKYGGGSPSVRQGAYSGEFESSIQYYHANYVRNAKAIGVLWAIFTLCFGIINIVCFVEPHWIGRNDNQNFGNFGLFRYCMPVLVNSNDLTFQTVCRGSLADFSSILNVAFRVATVFVGLSFLATCLCILAMLLFFRLHPRTVFQICGWIQTFSAFCMLLGVIIYPAGWDDERVRDVCGQQAANYSADECGIRWAMILAIIAIVDAIVLAALAFTLGLKYITAGEAGVGGRESSSAYKGDIHSAYSPGVQQYDGVSVISRKSMNLQPVMVPPGQAAEYDRHSQFSRTPGAARRDFNL